MTKSEADLVGRCLAETVKRLWRRGEIHTRIGVDDDDTRAIAQAWPGAVPAIDVSEVDRSVRGALREVASGLRFSDEQWRASMGGITRAQVTELSKRVWWQRQDDVRVRADRPESEMRSIFDLLEACDLLP